MSRRRSQPKHGGRQVFAVGGDPTDPTGFCVMVTDWVEWLRTHNFSHATLVQHSFALSKFVAWAELRGITRPADVTFPVLEAYQRHVALRKKSDGTPLAWSTQRKFLGAVRVFFSWCAKQHRILYNPAADLVMPRQNHKLPSATLTHDEAEVILAIPDVATPIGLRDRAVMEVLYATAMRRGELIGLDLPDVDLARRWLTLRNTKNRWDRVVPMGERATAWLTRYLLDARPHLLMAEDPGAVFLATNGERLGATWLTGKVHHYIDAADIGKVGSCHLFRHTAATFRRRGRHPLHPRAPRPPGSRLHPRLHPSRPRTPGCHPRRHPPGGRTADRHR
ncbi:MAG: tyrosine-type recombinase/integrase [Acidimicrobiales bacterium]